MPIPFAPRQMLYEPSTRAQDIILRQGDDAARAAQRSGQIWGGAVQNLGGLVAGVVQDRAEQKAMSRRDQAVARLWEESGGNPPPEAIIQIYGPKEGVPLVNAMQGWNEAKSKKGNEAIAGIVPAVTILKKLGPELRGAFWQSEVRPTAIAAGLGTEETLPAQFSEEILGQMEGLIPQAPLKTREVKIRKPDGSESIQIVEDVPGQEFTSAPPVADAGTFESFLASKYGTAPTPDQMLAARKAWAAADDLPKAPTEASYTPKVVTVDGQEVQANYDSKTGKYYDVETGRVLSGVKVAPTADMRNKSEGRKLVKSSIDAIKSIGDSIITKVGPSQRAEAIKRGAEAVFGADPEFRTYQDARVALAGNLAVAQQGSRPSDADVKSVWLPLVPDPYRDTAESAKMKWDLIRQMSNVSDPVATPVKKSAPSGPKPSGSKRKQVGAFIVEEIDE